MESSSISPPPVPSNNGLIPLMPGYDWDPSKCSIELLVTLVLVNVGMGPLDQSMKDVVQEQDIQNKVDADMIQYSSLVSEIEAASKEDGASGDPNLLKTLQAKLKSVLTNLFGTDAIVSKDGQYIIPNPESDVGKFITMLIQKNKNANDPNYDYHKDPVFSLLNQVGTYVFQNTVTGTWQTDSGSNSWSPDKPCPKNIWDTIMTGTSSDFQNMVNAMAGNHWLSENPGTKDGSGTPVTVGTDYLAGIYNQVSGAQSGLQGMGSQNTALIQTDSASENSLDQTGQNILNTANSLKLYILQKIGNSG